MLGLFHALGTSRLIAGTVCDTCCETAWNLTVGPVGGADPEAVEDSDLIVSWGADLVATNVHFWAKAEVAQKRGVPIVVIDPPRASSEANGGEPDASALEAVTLEEVRQRGRGRAAAELDARRAAVRPEDPFTFIYTSGTTGPPKGCVLSHGNYRAIVDMIGEVGEIRDDEVTYLYLPLAHSFALLIQLAAFDLQRHLVERRDLAKPFADVIDPKLGRGHFFSIQAFHSSCALAPFSAYHASSIQNCLSIYCVGR